MREDYRNDIFENDTLVETMKRRFEQQVVNTEVKRLQKEVLERTLTAQSGPTASMVYIVAITGLLSVGVIILVAYLAYRTWKIRQRDKDYDLDDGTSVVEVSNLKISQSTPDLIDECDKSREKGTVWSKVFARQTTLPVTPLRHESFQRQLSHKLELSNVEFTVARKKSPEKSRLGTLRPELYRTMSEQRRHSELYSKVCGKLYFSLFYDHKIENLIINVLKAENLPAKDFSGTSDPYLKVYLLPDRKTKFQTKVLRKTLQPTFDESFHFHVAYNTLPSRMLQFSLYDFDRFSRHDLIGIVLVKDLLLETDLSQETDYCRDVLSTNQENVDLGEMMLSLCYLPTAGRLTITVIKARNLKAMDITGSSDPYVKVSLMCRGKRIKKRKTTVKKNTLNPVYNEALVFDVPAENMDEVSLVVKVIDYDRVGSNELMGCLAVGPNTIGTSRDHWSEMLESPRKPIAQWYTLVESVPGLQTFHRTNAGSCLASS